MNANTKRLLSIELCVRLGAQPPEKIFAVVDKIGDRQGAEVFHFLLTQNENKIYDENLVSNRFELVKLKVLDELRTIIDSFDPATALIEIILDSHNLLIRLTLCCPNCRRKILESWGKPKGIVAKCHRCHTVCVPVTR